MTRKQIDEIVEAKTDLAKQITSEEMKDVLEQENISETDAEKILKKLYPDGANQPKQDDDAIDLSGFDYKNLVGANFKKYVELVGDRSYREFDAETGEEKPVVGRLKENDHYEFQLFKVDVVMKVRFPGIKDSPLDFIGLRTKTDRPEHTTKIPIRTAHELNAQILNAHSRAGHGKYYLLKK
jgi:hypothetical protein